MGIQVKEIRLGNCELFSSGPQKFVIKTDSKIHQNYYKYVKFEIISKYGDEIFCPITFAGVFGKNWLLVESEQHEEEELAKMPEKEKSSEPENLAETGIVD